MKNLYKKSVLFEVVNKNNPSEIIEAFTLTVPPNSIEIIQSQRVNRTKTFGGVFEDDYGMDTAKITISGNTGNEEFRATYIPGSGSSQVFNGKTTIYQLRDRIIRYKSNLENYGLENLELRFYDLSAIDSDTWGNSNGEIIYAKLIEAWVVSLDDFKMSRDKEKPLWFSYSIELLGISPLGINRNLGRPEVGEPIISPAPLEDTVSNIVTVEMGVGTQLLKRTKDAVLAATNSLRRGLNAVRNAFNWSQNLLNRIDNVNKLISDLQSEINEYIASAGNLVTTSLGIYRNLFGLAKFPGATAKQVMITVNDVMEELKDTIEFSQSIQNILGDDYDQIVVLANETKRIAAQIVKFGKSKDASNEVSIALDGKEVTIYGAKTLLITASSTLALVAASEYGDPSMELLLVTWNGVTDDDLSPGDTIEIPLLSSSIRNSNNEIYSLYPETPFGTDIKITADEGKLVFSETGDFSFVSGEYNMLQAINNRLNEYLGKRLRLTVYGLKVNIGSAMNNSAPVSYIITNIIDTVKQDPRVIDLENLKIKGLGDSLFLSFNVLTIENSLSYEGVL